MPISLYMISKVHNVQYNNNPLLLFTQIAFILICRTDIARCRFKPLLHYVELLVEKNQILTTLGQKMTTLGTVLVLALPCYY